MGDTMGFPPSMKAAILRELNQPLVIDEVEMPARLVAGQVAVRMAYSGICGAQLNEIAGVKGPDRFLPHLLGHEGSGHVVAIGEGVTTVEVGQTVVLHWRKGAGIQAAPALYRWRGEGLNAGWVTTFSEYTVVSENRVTAIPADYDLELAPLYGCAITSALGSLTNNARLTLGESIVVFGVGGVGLGLVLGAAMLSAHPIIAVDRVPAKLQLATELGATHTIDATELTGGDLHDRITGLLDGAQVDVAVDCTGSVEVIQTAYEVTGPQGRIILVGVPRKGDNANLHTLPLHFGKVLTGSEGGDTDPTTDIPRYMKLHRAGKLRLEPLVTDRFEFSEINEAIERVRRGQVVGRAVIRIG